MSYLIGEGNCPGGGNVRGEYVRGENVLHSVAASWITRDYIERPIWITMQLNPHTDM